MDSGGGPFGPPDSPGFPDEGLREEGRRAVASAQGLTLLMPDR
jgi:hypothetical protein